MRNKPNYNVSVTYGMPWLFVLGIIFVLLKAFEVGTIATWSWWLVLLPFYIGPAIVVTVLVAALIFSCLALVFAAIYDGISKYKRNKLRERK